MKKYDFQNREFSVDQMSHGGFGGDMEGDGADKNYSK